MNLLLHQIHTDPKWSIKIINAYKFMHRLEQLKTDELPCYSKSIKQIIRNQA